MTQAIKRDPIYRGRRLQAHTIELCVRWYITYRLSYRDLAAMMGERGIILSHTTIMRWVPTSRAGIRKALGSVCTSRESFLAHG
jgi:transposase-like protein